VRHIPTRNFVSLAAAWAGKGEGESGGGPGPFIEANGEAFDGQNPRDLIGERKSLRGIVSDGKLGWRREMTGAAYCQREWARTGSIKLDGPWALSGVGPKWFPAAFSCFFSFLPFLFLFSHFFYNFCILASI
jgi:hypothetical protein